MNQTRGEWITTLRLCQKAAAELAAYGSSYAYFLTQYHALVCRIARALAAQPDAPSLTIAIHPDELSGLIGYR